MNMPLAADHKGIPLLAALDEQLATVLASGAITKLLRAEFLLRGDAAQTPPPARAGADGGGARHPHLPHTGGCCCGAALALPRGPKSPRFCPFTVIRQNI